MYSNLPLPGGFTLTCFSIKTWLRLYFYVSGVHCGDDKGHGCLPFRWRYVVDLRLCSQVRNLPRELASAQSCCFPLLVLPSLGLVKHVCIWTDSFITSLMFLQERCFDSVSTKRWDMAEKESSWLSISAILQTGFVEELLWSKSSGTGKYLQYRGTQAIFKQAGLGTRETAWGELCTDTRCRGLSAPNDGSSISVMHHGYFGTAAQRYQPVTQQRASLLPGGSLYQCPLT